MSWVDDVFNDASKGAKKQVRVDSFIKIRNDARMVCEDMKDAGYDYDMARAWLNGAGDMIPMIGTMADLWALVLADVYGVDRPDWVDELT